MMPSMKAAIVAVGTELLGTDRLDTNSLFLTALLDRFGVRLVRKSIVGDEEEEIAREVRSLVADVDVVILSGGLGPTADDVTREGVALALGRELELQQHLVDEIARRFSSFGVEMPDVNRRQALVVSGAEVLPNPRGTAPGLRLAERDCTLFLFPGVPRELEGLSERSLVPWLEENSTGQRRASRILKVSCVSESVLEEWISPAYEEFGREAISVLASPGSIQVGMSVLGPPGSNVEKLDRMMLRMRELIGPAAYTDRDSQSFESVVGDLLKAKRLTVSTAESCTGGLVAERLTRVPGSSEFFVGSAVTYSNELKVRLLGVSPESLARHGAVSRSVVEQMARGVVDLLGSDLAIAVSGIAGPGGGTPDRPVGTVHVALADRVAGLVLHRVRRYPGRRDRVRWLSSQWGLEILRRHLLGMDTSSVADASRWPESRDGQGEAL